MERRRHISETQNSHSLRAQTERGEETYPAREPVEQLRQNTHQAETYPEQIRVREFLNSIDETILKDIFSEYFRKAGSEGETMNWIPLEQVWIYYKTPEEEEKSNSPYGSYGADRGIELYSHLFDSEAQMLWTLIHEECHAISQKKLEEFRIEGDYGLTAGSITKDSAGLAKKKYGTGEASEILDIKNRGINEGVTELLTERIFRDYLARSGQSVFGERPHVPLIDNPDTGTGEQRLEDIERWKELQMEETIAKQKFGAYERNWQNAKFYIGVISALTDIPQDTVEESVIRAYARNGSLRFTPGSEMESILTDIHPQLPVIIEVMIDSTKEKYPLSAIEQRLQELVVDLPEETKRKVTTAYKELQTEWTTARNTVNPTYEV